MCGDFECGSEENAKCTQDPKGQDEAYILEPFLEAKLEPAGWRDVLATVDVCVNKTTPIVFCDEEGYAIIPIQMVRLIPKTTKLNETMKRNP